MFFGNIWFWKDEKGVRHYSNISPPKGKSAREIEAAQETYRRVNLKKNRGYLFHVTRVFDGDTIQVAGMDLKFTLRMAGIDSPEIGFDHRPGQPFGRRAKKYLAELVADKKVSIKSYGTGGYNRQLAEVFHDDKNVNIEMIKAGLAEVYSGKLPGTLDAGAYFKAQAAAKKGRKGMWGQGRKYISPRQWRKMYPRK